MPSISSPNTILIEVQDDVLKRMGKRAEAYIQFASFNPSILGFVRAGSNVIYVNEIPYRRVAIDSEKSHDYLYVVILHEYLHLIGIADEREVRKITLEIVGNKFGENSNAFSFSKMLTFPEDVKIMENRKYFSHYM